MPLGNSRFLVRSFKASIFLSAYLLKDIAAVLANIMHPKIKKGRPMEILNLTLCAPNKKPMSANGSAKIVWLNLTSDK